MYNRMILYLYAEAIPIPCPLVPILYATRLGCICSIIGACVGTGVLLQGSLLPAMYEYLLCVQGPWR
jgi:hypothetical protein